MKPVRLYVIADAHPAFEPIEDFVALVIRAGAGMLQLREKGLEDGALLSVARRCAAVCKREGALFIVNDRVDIALASGADGVHVGQDDLPVDAVRDIAGPGFIIGLSTHTPEQVDRAQASDVDYIAVGPVHETPTKPGRPAVGLDLVRYAARHSTRPFFAIGGLDSTNIRTVLEAGAGGVSVLRCVSRAARPGDAVKELLQEFPASEVAKA